MAVIETVTFRLAPGVAETEFLDADGQAQTEFFYAQRGLVRRTTARGAGGEWLVLTLWGSSDDADASTEAGRHDAAASRWATCLEPSSVATNRYRALD
ncbi:MAG TPA: hypothetical protein VII76_01850 [Acidimicrobiales bacterium]